MQPLLELKTQPRFCPVIYRLSSSLPWAWPNMLDCFNVHVWHKPGNPYPRRMISTVDLLILSSSGQLLLLQRVSIGLICMKHAMSTRRSTVLSLSLQQVFPAQALIHLYCTVYTINATHKCLLVCLE